MKKRDSVVFGIALILIAFAILAEGLDLFGSIPLLKVILSILLGVAGLYDLIACKKFLRPMVFLGIILCMFQSDLGLHSLSYFMIMVMAVLLGVGLEMIFHHGHVHVFHSSAARNFKDRLTGEMTEEDEEGNYSNTNGIINIDSSFNAFTAYLTDEQIKILNIDSGMGAVDVYISEGCTLLPGAVANIDSGMGCVNVYFPASWRIQILSQDGNVTFNWDRMHEDVAPDAPLLQLNVDSGMGAVNLYKQ